MKKNSAIYKLLSDVFNISHHIACFADQHGNIFEVNKLFCDYFGYKNKDFINQSITAIVPEEHRSEMLHKYLEYVSKGENDLFDQWIVKNNNMSRNIFSVTLLHYDILENEKFVIFIFNNMPESVKRQEIFDNIINLNKLTNNEIYIFDQKNFHFVQVNQSALDNLGYTMEEMKRMTPWELEPQLSKYKYIKQLEPLKNNERDTLLYNTIYQRKDNTTYPVEVNLQLLKYECPPVYVGMALDISNLKDEVIGHLFEREFSRNTIEGMLVADCNKKIIQINEAFTRITGFNKEEIAGHHIIDSLSGLQDELFYKSIWDTVEHTGAWHGEILNRKKNGEIYSIWETIISFKDIKGKIINYIGIFFDITDKKKSEERIKYLEYYDHLTGLPNIGLFIDRFKVAIAKNERTKMFTSIMIIDLDNFRKINDSLGHDAGDHLLKETAERIAKCLRKYDTISRQGGDEFVILLSDIKSPYDPAKIATKILDVLHTPYNLNDQLVFITACIGISIYPMNGSDIQTLLTCANVAMYEAKQNGKNKYQFFSRKMTSDSLDKLVLETNLRFAIDKQEFILHYQPKVDIWSNTITGFEALVRWNRPDSGIIYPGDFIKTTETTGLIMELGTWILFEACKMQTRLAKKINSGSYSIAVNISLLQLINDDFTEIVMQIINETGIDPQNLELEITESFFMNDLEKNVLKLHKLKNKGVHITIDDFGTGYSSLQYLKNLPINKIKIDKSFVDDLISNPEDRAIISAIISMAHYLNLVVIAEGVTTEDQLNFLRKRRCNEVQGFYFSEAIPEEKIYNVIEEHNGLAPYIDMRY